MTTSLDPAKCGARVYGSNVFQSHQCGRAVWKDGWCKQHHPDSVKARNLKAQENWEQKRKQLPGYRLAEALKRITELEAEIAELRERALDGAE